MLARDEGIGVQVLNRRRENHETRTDTAARRRREGKARRKPL
jgi:hypothetical protein